MTENCLPNLVFCLKSRQILRAMKVLPTPPSALTTFAKQEQNNG